MARQLRREPPEAYGEKPGDHCSGATQSGFLRYPSVQVTDAINRFTRRQYEFSLALTERDSAGVALSVPAQVSPTVLAEWGELRVRPNAPARVVIDERTGTVVIGQDVQISPVAVTHGGELTIRVTETAETSQPAPRFEQGRRLSRREPRYRRTNRRQRSRICVRSNLKTLVSGLNQIQASSPRNYLNTASHQERWCVTGRLDNTVSIEFIISVAPAFFPTTIERLACKPKLKGSARASIRASASP